MGRKTQEQFEQEIFSINPDIIVKGTYKNNNTPIELYCNKHDYTWSQLPRVILSGGNCPYCNHHLVHPKDFLNRVNILNQNVEVLDDYINDNTKIRFLCKVCNKITLRTPFNFYEHPSCPKCRDRKRRDTADFIEEMKEINKDIEIIGDFKNFQTKIKCRCKIHNFEWKSLAQNLLRGHGCPMCNQSIGEKRIIQILNELKINYEYEKVFDDCKDINVLPYDFYLKDYNTCIEFDGIQHFKPVKYFGGENNFIITKRHDNIKTQYCKDNGIKLLRISYKEYNDIYDIIVNYISSF